MSGTVKEALNPISDYLAMPEWGFWSKSCQALLRDDIREWLLRVAHHRWWDVAVQMAPDSSICEPTLMAVDDFRLRRLCWECGWDLYRDIRCAVQKIFQRRDLRWKFRSKDPAKTISRKYANRYRICQEQLHTMCLRARIFSQKRGWSQTPALLPMHQRQLLLLGRHR